MRPLVSLLIVSFVPVWAPISAIEAQDKPARKSRFVDADLQTRIYQLKNIELYESTKENYFKAILEKRYKATYESLTKGR